MAATLQHRRHAWLLAAGACALGVGIVAAGCARGLRQVQLVQGHPASVGELWQEPADIEQRDLFHGPGGPDLMPRDTSYTFVARDTSGWSPGFDVRSQDGVEWSVKLGPEAQTEVVSSRILWAIGFHQPPTYYRERWSLTGEESGPQQPGRFRPSLARQAVVGDWSWYENPFVGSREFGGLIVTNLILNSWDWKTSNNKIYRLSPAVNGVGRWFVVRDLGASLGKTNYPAFLKWFRLRGFGQGTRNDLPGFEEQGFIERIDAGSQIEFDYRGIYRDVIDSVRPEDVRWACILLSRLSDDQWRDAFRAGGYNADQTSRYVRKIKAKIARGLELTGA
ncbi:MAG TPA: hypothetical protein VJ813_08910 [Vicinamibacterales bacterium]|nr:hypothetical protein [Vicinamibacterales bacterium]